MISGGFDPGSLVGAGVGGLFGLMSGLFDDSGEGPPAVRYPLLAKNPMLANAILQQYMRQPALQLARLRAAPGLPDFAADLAAARRI